MSIVPPVYLQGELLGCNVKLYKKLITMMDAMASVTGVSRATLIREAIAQMLERDYERTLKSAPYTSTTTKPISE